MVIFILFTFFILILFGIIINLYEKSFSQNLFEEKDFAKLTQKGIYKLELKRAIVTSYLSLTSTPKRKIIGLDAKEKIKSGPFNINEEELFVVGWTKKSRHEIFKCYYTEENKTKLNEIVEDYNSQFCSRHKTETQN